MNANSWVSIIAVCASLVLAWSALRSQRITGRKMLPMALGWIGLFVLVAAVFAAVAA